MISVKIIEKYIRSLILGAAFGLSVIIFLFYKIRLDSGSSFYTSLTDGYGVVAAGTLYLSLIISPIYFLFPKLPFRVLCFRARRAIGVTSFYFGMLHGSISFFGLLGGVDGLGFLSVRYIYAIIISLLALIILIVLAFTSLDFAQRKMKKWWIYVHRLIYIAGLLIFFHVIMLGTGYADIKSVKGIFFLSISAVLILLEGLRLNNYLVKRFKLKNNLSFVFIIYVVIFSIRLTVMFSPTGLVQNLQVHDHDTATSSTGTNVHGSSTSEHTFPRYDVILDKSDNIVPGQSTQLNFTVRDATNGNQVVAFQQVLGQPSHLLVVDNELKYFSHLHPIYDNGRFSVDVKFPENRLYRMYFEFQPSGENEQQFAFVVKTENFEPQIFAEVKDTNKIKNLDTAGKYKIEINDVDFTWKELLNGFQKISFNIKDVDKITVDNLQPYLNQYGHVFAVSTADYSGIHIHADRQILYDAKNLNAKDLSFIPLNLYNEVNKSGLYKLFVEFKIDDTIYNVQYVVNIK